MPIRTNRGRAAALRRLWGWPMRSTRHLSATLAVVTVVLATGGIGAGAGWLGTGGDQQSTPHASAPSTSQVSSSDAETPSSASDVPDSSSTHTPSTMDAPAPLPGRAAHDPRPPKVALSFARAFAHHPPEMPRQEWVQRIAPHVMPESRGLLSTINPSTVDVTRVVGPPTMQQAGDAVARVTVPMDTHPLTVRVVQAGGQWQVRSWGGE